MATTDDWDQLYDFAQDRAPAFYHALVRLDHDVMVKVKSGVERNNPDLVRLMAEHDALTNALRLIISYE